MSAENEITRIKTNISNAYTSAENKEATIPATKNLDNLANTITSIPEGSGINGKLVTKTTTEAINSGEFVMLSGSNVKKVTSGGSIYGIAKTSGQANQTIEVYVPDV